MSDHSGNVMMEVQIELGHSATLRERPTKEGYTHDWKVWVQSVDDVKLETFVEKIIFNLHKSFPNPRRVLEKPPYIVSESGFGGFDLPIEIHFKTGYEPRKVSFIHDLSLHGGEGTLSFIKFERLKFTNFDPEFQSKLLMAENGHPESPITGSSGNGDDHRQSHTSSSKNELSGSIAEKNIKEKKIRKWTPISPPRFESQQSHSNRQIFSPSESITRTIKY